MKKVLVGGLLIAAALVMGQASNSNAESKLGSRFAGGLKLTTWSPLDHSRPKPAKRKNFEIVIEGDKAGRIYIIERKRNLRLSALPEFSDGSLEASGVFTDPSDQCVKTVTYRVGPVRKRRTPVAMTIMGDCRESGKGYQAGYLEKYSGVLRREKRARR